MASAGEDKHEPDDKNHSDNNDGGDVSGGGGTMIRFSVGRPGTSAAHLRYISRASAVRERAAGALCHNLPDEFIRMPMGVARTPEDARGATITPADPYDPYARLRANLLAWAWVRERQERRCPVPRGKARTHYRCTVSFERDVPTERIKSLLAAWLGEQFPAARAVAFVHRDTGFTHAHCWLDARLMTGRKIQLDKQAFRSLDEAWNRQYAPAMGRDVQEHLTKKGAHLEKKGEPRDRKGAPVEKKGSHPNRADYQERDLRGVGAALAARADSHGRSPSEPFLSGRSQPQTALDRETPVEASLPPGGLLPVHLPKPGEVPLPRSGRVPLRCSCRPRRVISATRATAAAGLIFCGRCAKPFVEISDLPAPSGGEAADLPPE